MSVTVAEPVLELSATLAAVTVTCDDPIDAGEVYKPELLMPPAPAGLIDHVTVVSLALLTVAVNCLVWDGYIVALVGEMLTEMGGERFTVAEPALELSATLVAITVTVCGDVIDTGAVYRPEPLMPPTPAGLIDQVTAVLPVLPTVAVNCLGWEAYSVVLAGEMLTEMGAIADWTSTAVKARSYN